MVGQRKWMKLALALLLAPGCAQLLSLDDYGEGAPSGSGGAAGKVSSGTAGDNVGGDADGGGASGPGGHGNGGEALPASEQYRSAVGASNPAAYWRLDEPSGAVANDLFAGHHGQYGANVALGAEGIFADDSAVGLTGVGASWVTIPLPDWLSGTDAFSIELWFSLPGLVSLQGMFDRVQAGAGVSLATNGNGLLVFLRSDGTTVHRARSKMAVTPSVFHHAVAVYDGVALMLYLDGELQETTPSSLVVPPVTTTTLLGILGSTSSPNSMLEGALDEVAFYAYALPQELVEQHWALGMP
jgi:hypothetical protein